MPLFFDFDIDLVYFITNKRSIYFSFSKYDRLAFHIIVPNDKWLCDKHKCLDHTKFPGLHDNLGCNEDNSPRL